MSSMFRVTRPAEAESAWVVRARVRYVGTLDGTDPGVLEVEVPPGSGTPAPR